MYQRSKKVKAYIPAVLMFSLSLCIFTSCGKDNDIVTTTQLEPYTEEQETIEKDESEKYAGYPTETPEIYQYLERAMLTDGNTQVWTYAFPGAVMDEQTGTLESEMSGIRICSHLMQGSSASCAEDVAMREKGATEENGKTDMEEQNGSYVISYSITAGGTSYPCSTCISAVDVLENTCLVTAVTIDTSKFTESDMPVIEEVASIWPVG